MDQDGKTTGKDFRDEIIRGQDADISQLRSALENADRQYTRLLWQAIGGLLVAVIVLGFNPGFTLMSDGTFEDRIDSERRRAVEEESVSMFNEYLETTFLCSATMMWERDRLWPPLVSALESEYDLFQMSEDCFDWDGSESPLMSP